MRIHELLEAIIDFVVVEGVLGVDPIVVREHLHTVDPKVDAAYFVLLWPHIAAHKLLHVTIAADLPPAVAAAADTPVAESSAQAHAQAAERPAQPMPQLFTFLDNDDGGDPPISTLDLPGLLARYPGRVRLRCTNDEIYYRLTGSRQRLAARGREKGIAAIELGPLTGLSQKSVFHYVRVLVQLGLCAKIPTTVAGASTNVLVYRKFLDKNPNYRAHVRKSMVEAPVAEASKEEPDADADADADDATPVEESGDGPARLDFNFQPFSEMELVAGYIPRERLIRVLEHPALTDHMLGNHHLLQVIGWPEGYKTRHRRQLLRHISAMVDEGVIEYVHIANEPKACIRLTKYNPDHVPEANAKKDCTLVASEVVSTSHDDYVEPFQYTGPALATHSLESQILEAIKASGEMGRINTELTRVLSGLFRRTTEHVINRHDLVFLPPTLRHRAIRCVMESVHRERRLRLFAIPHYVQYMQSLGEDLVMPETPEAGKWEDISYRTFAASPYDFFAMLAKRAVGVVPLGQGKNRKRKGEQGEDNHGDELESGGKKTKGRPRGPGKGKGKQRAAAGEDGELEEEGSRFKYKNDVQQRGRPRKYVYVVNQDGSRNRHIVGDLKSDPSLPPLLIYLPDHDLLVLPPKGYTGVGVPPPIPEEVLAQGKPPSFYGPAGRSKGKGSTKRKAQEDEVDAEDEFKPKAKKSRAAPKKRKNKDQVADKDAEQLVQQTNDAEASPGAPMVEPALDDLPTEFASAEYPPVESTPADAPPTLEDLVPGARRTRRRSRAPLSEATVATTRSTRTIRGKRPGAEAPVEPVLEAAETVEDKMNVDALAATPTGPLMTSWSTTSDGGIRFIQSEPLGPLIPRLGASEANAPEGITTEGPIENVAMEGPAHGDDNSMAFVRVLPQQESADIDLSIHTPNLADVQIDPALFEVEQPPAAAHPDMATAIPATIASPTIVESIVATKPQDDLPISAQMAFLERQPPAKVADAVSNTINGQRVEDDKTEGIDAKHKMTRRPPSPQRVPRIDVASLRRVQEIQQCLVDAGGVMTESKLFHGHREWVNTWAGTERAGAPAIGTGMDRKVYKRILNHMVDTGRLKERIANMPTSTGRWLKLLIYYLPEVEDDKVNSYIHSLANMANTIPSSPQPHMRSKVAQRYSMYKKTRPSTLSLAAAHEMSSPPLAPDMAPREVYLNEPGVVAALYGYVSGRNLRTKILHKAILETMVSEPDLPSIVSTTPRVFAMPLVFEELRMRDWLRIMQVIKWDEDLYEWIKDADNRNIKLKDLPPNIAEKVNKTGRSWHSANITSIRSLLSILTFLQLVTPVQPCDETSATVKLPEARGEYPRFFERSSDGAAALFFVLHDVVPVYNLADPSLSLIGFLPAAEEMQLDHLWSMIQQAAQTTRQPHLARMDIPPFPFSPQVTGVLDMTTNMASMLQLPRRWRHELKMLPGQRAALNATIDSEGNRNVTAPEDVSKLAWDNALTPADAEAYLVRRRRLVLSGEAAREQAVRERARASAVTRPLITRRPPLIDQSAERAAIRNELARRICQARKVYDERVQKAAARVGVEVTQELQDYILRNRPMSRLGEIISDAQLATVMESFVRAQSGIELPRRSYTHRPAPSIRPRRGGKPVRPKGLPPPTQDPNNRGIKRYRHIWTKEEEDLLLDAEAVIRARSRHTQQRGRSVMQQIFPQIGDQVLRGKIKKLLEAPGKFAYYTRLEDAVATLLEEHTGGSELPDPHPGSIINFDLRTYVEFVRARISKSLLKIPVSSAPEQVKVKTPELPRDPRALMREYEWEYLRTANAAYDQVLDNVGSDEGKLHNICLGSIVENDPPVAQPNDLPVERQASVIRSAVKMVVSTPMENYSMDEAARVLGHFAKEEYEPQIAALVNDGVLNKNINSMRTPGRMYGFSNPWCVLSEGTLPPELPEEIRNMRGRLDEGEVVWPLAGQPGDLALLMELVSGHQVDFDFDVSDIPALDMERLIYNTRGLTDASFECDVFVTCRNRAPPARGPPSPIAFPSLVSWPGVTPSNTHVDRVMAAIEGAGADGIEVGMLQMDTRLSVNDVDAALAALALEETPRLFWAGYGNALVVARKYWSSWCVTVSGESGALPCMPRRWVDIRGAIIPEAWDLAVKAVIGQMLLRPGITEHALRARVNLVLDRMEVSDVLQNLIDCGWVRRDIPQWTGRAVPPVHATDAWMARNIVCTPTDKLWS